MTEKTEDGSAKPATQETPAASDANQERRAILKKLGRFAGVTPPAVTLLLAAAVKPKQARAASREAPQL